MAATPLSHENHVIPIRVYLFNLIALGVLMASTVALSYVPIPGIGPISGVAMNNIVAMLIATLKATLVIMYFMHVRWGTQLTKLWVIIGFSFASLMAITLIDYGTRSYEAVPGWDKKLDSALPRVLDNGLHPSDPMDMNVRPRQ